ncbi:nucleotidyltransferase family protein [Xylella taiwanensis]|uniref:Mannose-1-phosphate guanylyltransferase n=1 Tax=Xylella taiwanensis TaxID=1444770 RepID=Z9JM60_9GAMM|nr:nucleotidyltransferase family protein [Xylella taiwanensis]AXI84053.1 mannose-1-phosphate guanylyltransferase [Xylella taiwanensis]EWS79028.1 mannose-1-phosphate guanylyltransferase [Xylella taiwanensis]MCD8457166.1 nucleotidyltransferase family protein [Xylella taiwanensis]MCD8459575.1 nucleotidyltransferase family protein [Xylella taiwanensis]MCD8461558.1 nucleotidyltransferase family protein [Xylella taiwanensis]
MKALIFAAGIGERMRPLTNHTPKPLLCAGGEPLIVWHLRKLAALGIREVVINTAWLGEQFPETLGDGQRFDLHLVYSYEGLPPLETGGGMLHALPLLGTAPFLAVNGDIWTDADFTRLPTEPVGDAHLMLVDNPEYHPQGDFALQPDGKVLDRGPGIPTLTFAGLGIYRSQLLTDWQTTIGNTPDTQAQPPRFKLAPLLRAAIQRSRIHGTHHRGQWTDVGTPQRLHTLDTWLRSQAAS